MKRNPDRQTRAIECDNGALIIVYYYNIQELLLAKKVATLIKEEVLSDSAFNAKIVFNESKNLLFKIKRM